MFEPMFAPMFLFQLDDSGVFELRMFLFAVKGLYLEVF